MLLSYKYKFSIVSRTNKPSTELKFEFKNYYEMY